MLNDEEPPRLVFFKEDVERISKTLVTFLRNTQARGVLLVDKDGHFLTREGDASTEEMNAVSALVSDSFAGRLSRDRDDFLLSRVGQRTILAVVTGSEGSLEMIRLYADSVRGKLDELFSEVARRGREGPDSGDGAGAPVRA